MDYADWNRGLLLGELLIVVAGMSLVSARSSRDALLAVGVLVQGIVMTFAAGGAYFPRAEFAVATTAMIALFGLWCLWTNAPAENSATTSVSMNVAAADEVALAPEPGASPLAAGELSGEP